MIPLPSKPHIVSEDGNRAVFEIENLYPGYGLTTGNALRRVLLSSLKGAAITSVKIEGVQHEFSTVEGVMEDVVEIILNLKQLRFRLHDEGPFTITLSVKGEKEVRGEDFKTSSQVEIINQNAHIATLSSKKAVLNMEATVESGLGYVPLEARTKDKVEVGTIALDASFSPVRHVNYEVENMRVGDRTDYNRLRVDIETDGSLAPREAFERALNILVEQFNMLRGGFIEKSAAEESKVHGAVSQGESDSSEKESYAKTKLDEVKLSNRTMNSLREAGIKTIGGLSRKRESALREIEGIGEKGIQEIKKALGGFGVTLKP